MCLGLGMAAAAAGRFGAAHQQAPAVAAASTTVHHQVKADMRGTGFQCVALGFNVWHWVSMSLLRAPPLQAISKPPGCSAARRRRNL